MDAIRLTETQAIMIETNIDGFVACRRKDTMAKLVKLGLVVPYSDGISGMLTPLGRWVEELLTKYSGQRYFSLGTHS